VADPDISPEAEADLDGIDDYLFERDTDVAARFASEFHRLFQLLAERPYLGRPSDYAVGLRRFALRPFIIFYRPVTGGIEVVRVLHGARDLREAFIDSNR